MIITFCTNAATTGGRGDRVVTDVHIFSVQNMHRQTRKTTQLGWILLSDIHKHLENKCMNNKLIDIQLIFPTTQDVNLAVLESEMSIRQ